MPYLSLAAIGSRGEATLMDQTMLSEGVPGQPVPTQYCVSKTGEVDSPMAARTCHNSWCRAGDPASAESQRFKLTRIGEIELVGKEDPSVLVPTPRQCIEAQTDAGGTSLLNRVT